MRPHSALVIVLPAFWICSLFPLLNIYLRPEKSKTKKKIRPARTKAFLRSMETTWPREVKVLARGKVVSMSTAKAGFNIIIV